MIYAIMIYAKFWPLCRLIQLTSGVLLSWLSLVDVLPLGWRLIIRHRGIRFCFITGGAVCEMEKQRELLLNNPYQYFAYYQHFEKFVNKPNFLTNVKSRFEVTQLLYCILYIFVIHLVTSCVYPIMKIPGVIALQKAFKLDLNLIKPMAAPD